MLLHFKQLTSCPPPAPQGRCWPDWGVPENYHLSPLLIWYLGPPSLGKPGQLECPWPWACAWSAYSWALIPEQPGVSNNHSRGQSEGGCCGKEGELRNVAGGPREGTDGQITESAVGCGLLVYSWWNWFVGLRTEQCHVLCQFSTPTPFPYPRAFWTQLPGQQWDRTSGCPCYEGSDSH